MSEFAIVGRVRKPHGIKGDLFIEPLSSEPEEVFAPGRVVFVGNDAGALDARHPDAVEIVHARPFKDGWLVGLHGVRDRNTSELWRERYLLAEASGLRPPASGETFLHELPGMRVVRKNGDAIGDVTGSDEVPQGLLLRVRTERGEASIPFVDAIVLSVDRDARVIVVDPPEGLLEL